MDIGRFQYQNFIWAKETKKKEEGGFRATQQHKPIVTS